MHRSQEEVFFNSIPEERRFLLDKPLDYDHGGVQRDLGKIADSMDEWEGRVAEELELTKAEIAGIKTKYPGELNLQTRALLQKWQEKHTPHNATYRNLAIAFLKAGKGDFANTVCGILQEKYTSEDPQEKKCGERHLKVSQADSVIHYASYLKGVYEHASDKKVPKVAFDKFIELAVVKKTRINRLEADKFTKATLHGHIDEILREKEPIQIEELLKPEEGQKDLRCVFIQGAPGIGKSTFALEFCRRWDEIELLRNYLLVVLLRLREKRVRQIQNVADLFYHYDDPELQQAVAREVIRSEGKNILLVLDGFDELPTAQRTCSLFVDIIRGVRLPYCTVLVTSRPSVTADLHLVAQPQKEVEILGFTQERVKQYASHVFASQPEILSDFLTYISANPAIRSMMYIPLNSAIVVEVYRANRTAGRPIPQTMTQLYSELCLVLLTRHLIDKGDPLANELPEKLEDLPTRLYTPLIALAKLALVSIFKKSLIFTKLPDECQGDHFGFMNALSELYMGHKAKKSYNFLHLTFQEFLAAFYIPQCPPCTQTTILSKIDQYDSEWNMVGRFAAGLSGITESWIKSFPEVNPALIQCLYESQSGIDYQAAFGGAEICFRGSRETSIFDCYAAGQCIAKSNCDWELQMSYSGLDGEAISMLACGLRSNANVSGSIKHLVFSGNPIGNGITHLKELPPTIKERLSQLELCDCKLDHLAFGHLVEILPSLSQLKVLDISHNPLGAGKLVQLLETLSNLTELIMSSINMSTDDINALSSLIKNPSASMKRLTVGSGNMSSECVELLLKTTLARSSLEELRIFLLVLTSKTTEQFENISQNLLILELYRCKSTNTAIPHLAKTLSTNTTLKELDIVFPNGEVSLCDPLNDALQNNNTTLQRLRIKPLSTETPDKLDKRIVSNT